MADEPPTIQFNDSSGSTVAQPMLARPAASIAAVAAQYKTADSDAEERKLRLLCEGGTELPYLYKRSQWPKTPKALVMEFFQQFNSKPPKWTTITSSNNRHIHLVKCSFPEEFKSIEFVPNRMFNNVKIAEHNVSILVLAYLNAIPFGYGDPEVHIPRSSFVAPMTNIEMKRRLSLCGKRKAAGPPGVYSSVPPPSHKMQRSDEPEKFMPKLSRPTRSYEVPYTVVPGSDTVHNAAATFSSTPTPAQTYASYQPYYNYNNYAYPNPGYTAHTQYQQPYSYGTPYTTYPASSVPYSAAPQQYYHATTPYYTNTNQPTALPPSTPYDPSLYSS